MNFLTMLMLKSSCGINLHQYLIGTVGGNDVTIDFMHDLYVWINRSDGFVLLMSGGVYCFPICWLAMKS